MRNRLHGTLEVFLALPPPHSLHRLGSLENPESAAYNCAKEEWPRTYNGGYSGFRLQLLMLGRNLLALHSPCAGGGPEQRISNGTILNNWSPAFRTAASVKVNPTGQTTISAAESATRVFVWNPVGQDPLLLSVLLPSATTPQGKPWHC